MQERNKESLAKTSQELSGIDKSSRSLEPHWSLNVIQGSRLHGILLTVIFKKNKHKSKQQ